MGWSFVEKRFVGFVVGSVSEMRVAAVEGEVEVVSGLWRGVSWWWMDW